MKKIRNKLFIFLALSALLVPTVAPFAEEEVSPTPTPSPVPTPEPTPEPTPTPTPTPEQPSKEDTEAILSNLITSKGTWNKTFSSSTFDYTVTVASDVSGIIITPTVYGNGVVSGDTGTKSLENGDNIFKITVTSKDGNASNQYTIKVVRATSNLTLKSLKIKGQNLNEVFTTTTYDYTADITYNVESITVQAAAEDENATVTVTGSANLKVGKNTVKVIVKNQAGDYEEYRIIVTRGSEEDLNTPPTDDENSGVETTLIESENQDIPSTPNPNSGNTLKYVLVVVFCLLLLAIAGIGIYFYIKTGDSQKKKQKKIEKLKKKQAKINQELTGLIPVVPEDSLKEEKELEDSQEEQLEEEIDDLEDTIELDFSDYEEKTREIKNRDQVKRRSDKNVLEDFDDLFLDE